MSSIGQLMTSRYAKDQFTCYRGAKRKTRNNRGTTYAFGNVELPQTMEILCLNYVWAKNASIVA